MREIKIGAKYKHFKDKTYKVLDIVYDVESKDEELKKIVIYEALYGDHIKWARAYDDFISEVDYNKYPEAKQKFKFEEVEEDLPEE